MKNQYIHIKTESLNNHCPECFSTEGLQLSFKQKHNETRFYKAMTNDITYELKCETCNSEIFPVRWTNDIERVVDYKKKAFTPKPKSFKLKRLAWILLISLDALILLGILFAVGVIKI
ncbi:hypothetical protein MWU58_01600 [Flavobacteriaceae bacterium S0825]|uniref:hypothetical protein n=1 Tax=Gaetbulibacter sp. S0825 TaxID=2720084 RepID=UPI0014312557|nr:hypothetical protein [Gaetbulibacter sp. S0825]MCK0107977.1 hypothetical protein [Flavobacteriaceae bacterium S0825]NIX63613.1 hypothetical protein [Gaetbulibacter sp. S0825]